MPRTAQCSLPAAAVGAEGAVEEGDSLAWLGLCPTPTDGLSLVPRNTCFCSNFIRPMLLQPGTPTPHSNRLSKNSQGHVQLPVTKHLPSVSFRVSGGLSKLPISECHTLGLSLPQCSVPQFPPSALTHSSQKAEWGVQERSQRPEGINPLL